MTQWLIERPSAPGLREMLAAYGCTATISGAIIIVTHTSGSTAEARTPDEALRAAIALARAG
jgi:hypothetical protein